MSSQSRVNVSWMALIIGAVLLLGAGAGVAYLGLRSKTATGPASDTPMAAPGSMTPASESPSANNSGPLDDVTIMLSTDAVSRAGITVSAVTTGTSAEGLRARESLSRTRISRLSSRHSSAAVSRASPRSSVSR